MQRMRLASLLAVSAALTTPAVAEAEETLIQTPGAHPAYRFEAEPHGLIGFGPLDDRGGSLGAGFRGTIVAVDNGFVPTINNSVGVSVGADMFLRHGAVFLPVAMQWNFWLTNHWSVFGEPGIGLTLNADRGRDYLSPILMIGGRYHFNDKVALTIRLGYPELAVGASFFL